MKSNYAENFNAQYYDIGSNKTRQYEHCKFAVEYSVIIFYS